MTYFILGLMIFTIIKIDAHNKKIEKIKNRVLKKEA